MQYFKIVFKNNFIYRWPVFFATVSSVVGITVYTLLWNFLYSGNEDMVSYMIKYTILARVFSLFYCKGMTSRIGERVSSGDFVLDMIKPISIFSIAYQQELASMITQLLLRGIPIMVIYLPFLLLNKDYGNIFVGVISIIFSHTLFVLMYSLLGFMAYTVVNVWPFQRILDDTIRIFGGGLIPLTLLGNKAYFWANMLPFKYLYSFPLEIILNNTDKLYIIRGFVEESIWIFFLSLLNIFVYKRVIRKVVVQGG